MFVVIQYELSQPLTLSGPTHPTPLLMGPSMPSIMTANVKDEFEKTHAADVKDGFIKEFEGAEVKTRKGIKNSAKVSHS